MEVKYNLDVLTPRTVANTEGTGRGNTGGLALRNFCVAIDSTFYTTLGHILRQNLEKQFNLPVKYLIITHYHADHTFGIGAFKDLCVISSKQTVNIMNKEEIIQRYKQYIRELENDDPLGKNIEYILPSLLFNDSIIIQDGDKHIEVFHTGGHTAGSSFIYYPDEKVVFAGDLIFENMIPYAGDETGLCDPDKWIIALEKIRDLKPEIIVPGHGPVMKGVKTLDRHILFLKTLRENIIMAIKENLKVDDIDFPDVFEEVNEEMKSVAINYWLQFYKK